MQGNPEMASWTAGVKERQQRGTDGQPEGMQRQGIIQHIWRRIETRRQRSTYGASCMDDALPTVIIVNTAELGLIDALAAM